MAYNKITAEQLEGIGVAGLPDTPQLSCEEMQRKFEEIPIDVIIPAFNALVDRLTERDRKTYTRSEVDEAIADIVLETGRGDMAKSVYDSDNDGRVDVSMNGIFNFTHSYSYLNGEGVNGKVKATRTETYSAFTVNGTVYSVRAGEETSVEFVSGVWYTFVLDEQAKTINFKQGGGVSSKKLGEATAMPTDVRKGKTFYSGDKTLKTGEGGVGATGVLISRYNNTVSVAVGFQPEKIVLSYQYDGGDTHIWLEFNADSPGVFTVHTSKGYNDAAVKNAIASTGNPESVYGYIKATETGFDFMGYYASSGNRTIRYVCY